MDAGLGAGRTGMRSVKQEPAQGNCSLCTGVASQVVAIENERVVRKTTRRDSVTDNAEIMLETDAEMLGIPKCPRER